MQTRRRSILNFVVVSSILMCLGWGLRGYIGGGPLGAMIPGAFIALWLCVLLGVDGRRPALVAVFSAAGIGFGGEMTYGQTIGLLKSPETYAWGLTGLTLKGGIWGLLGGAMIGMGFIAHRLTIRQAAAVLLIFLLVTVAGIALINEPKLIYFSDPHNKPRDEVWAGLLLGATALLLCLHRLGMGKLPLRYALYGVVGGAIGFGGGGALHSLGFLVADNYNNFPWWKLMEFFFGACLGIAYGWCAMRTPIDEHGDAKASSAQASWQSILAALLLVTVGLLLWNWTAEGLIAATPAHPLAMPFARVVFGFTTLGCVFCLLGMRWETLAWQAAISITFVASIIDLQEDMAGLPNLLGSAGARWGMVVLSMVACAGLVLRWQGNTKKELSTLLLWLMWACVAVAFARVCIEVVTILPRAPEELRPWYSRAMREMARHWLVHGGFLVMAIVVTARVCHDNKEQ